MQYYSRSRADVAFVSFPTMFRFLCFNAPVQCHKPKKTFEPSVEANHETLQVCSQLQAPKASLKGTSLNGLLLRTQGNAPATDDTKDATSSASVELGCKSDDIKGEVNVETSRLPRKSQSLGTGLCDEGSVLCGNDTEDGIDRGFSSDSLDQNGLVPHDGIKDPGISSTSQNKRSLQAYSFQVSSDLIRGSIFSINDPQLSEKGLEISDVLYDEGANESGNHTPCVTPTLVKSHTLPNTGPTIHTSDGYSAGHSTTHSRSSEDQQVLRMRWEEIPVHEIDSQIGHEHEGDDNIHKTEKNNFENSHEEAYDCYNVWATAKDWIVPLIDEVNSGQKLKGQSSTQMWEQFPAKDFKIKRIEEWVNEIQHYSLLEDANRFLDTNDVTKSDTILTGLNVPKVDNKVTPGMEAAKRYISVLSASATTAQMSNHGLVVIPLLSAFFSLRVLNLSGNFLERITAGALPRGLHMLNLSRNNISTIEGLRELTRLRVLDLSYNRIFRIGHGLASCSSLKELYLAGNKISEVEGLHRLLKLTMLDLRFNKISTAKCLGQLAANYNTLQAISLEGNPAQKNVGDEQLKKYLQGLLSNLVFFNRQPIKVSPLKDAADRSVRLGISAHQFDRGLRSVNKAARKASHGLAGSRLSSIHVRKSQAVISPKRSRGRRVHLPPSGTKSAANHQHHYPDVSNKLLNLRSELAIRKSQSEGALGAL